MIVVNDLIHFDQRCATWCSVWWSNIWPSSVATMESNTTRSFTSSQLQSSGQFFKSSMWQKRL